MELGDKFNNICPYCESKNIKSWGSCPIGTSKNPYAVLEEIYTCRECLRNFCVVNGNFSYLE